MVDKYRVSWLFTVNDNLMDRLANSFSENPALSVVKPLGTRDAIFKDFNTMDEARSFKSSLVSIVNDLKGSGLYVELHPHIVDVSEGY